MKTPVILFVLIVCIGSSLSARTWTDTNGRTMEADIVSADETKVTVLMAGKKFELPLTKLSEEDQKFVKDWVEEQEEDAENPQEEAAAPKAPGELNFDGKPLLTGGKVNTFEFEHNAEQLAKVKKAKGTDTGYKILTRALNRLQVVPCFSSFFGDLRGG